MTIPSNDVQAVIFDLDGTLRHSEPNGMDVFHDRAASLGLPVDKTVRRQAARWNHRYWADSGEREADAEAADGDHEMFWLRYAQRHLQALGVPEGQAQDLAPEFHLFMSEQYQPVDVVPDDVIPTLRTLAERGYRLGLVSNRSEPFDETLASLDLAEHFEFTLAAGEVGWWKPDPRLLTYAAEQLEIDPLRALYVGDNPYADVEGARGAGLRPVLIDAEDLFPDFECPKIRAIGEVPGLLAD